MTLPFGECGWRGFFFSPPPLSFLNSRTTWFTCVVSCKFLSVKANRLLSWRRNVAIASWLRSTSYCPILFSSSTPKWGAGEANVTQGRDGDKCVHWHSLVLCEIPLFFILKGPGYDIFWCEERRNKDLNISCLLLSVSLHKLNTIMECLYHEWRYDGILTRQNPKPIYLNDADLLVLFEIDQERVKWLEIWKLKENAVAK